MVAFSFEVALWSPFQCFMNHTLAVLYKLLVNSVDCSLTGSLAQVTLCAISFCRPQIVLHLFLSVKH